MNKPVLKVGVAGVGAIGGAVCKALTSGIPGLSLIGVSEQADIPLPAPNMSFAELAQAADVIVEALPARIVPDLAREVLTRGKTLIAISSAALLLYPEIIHSARSGHGRIIAPSGALAGIDGIRALSYMGIREAKICSTKPPKGFTGAPYVVENEIDLAAITEKTRLFEGNAFDAARGFPANVNVAATLSLAGIGPEKTRVEIWADPDAKGNTHEITVAGEFSTIAARIDNVPDPANPKSSMLAAQSIVAALHNLSGTVVIGT